MSQNYYRVIDGHKYDSELISLADRAVAGQRDGRISLEDAKLLLAGVKDANKYTDIEKATMHYIRDHYRFTPPADQWFRTQIRSWAAAKGWAGHSAGKDKVAAEAYGAEPATTVVSPPPAGISGGPESGESQESQERESHEEIPPAAPAASPAQTTPAPPQAEPARPGSRPRWLIPLAAGGAILAVVAVFVFWPAGPPTVETPPPEAPQASAQADAAAPAPAETPQASAQADAAAPAPAEAAGTEREQSQAVETAPAAGETAAVARESQAPGGAAPGVSGGTHIVERGDTLWAIAETRYGDARLWPRIYRANQERIRNPDLIYPGAQITVPALRE